MPRGYKLITEDNSKQQRGNSLGYRSAVLHLLPHRRFGKGNLCPNASEGCSKSCLATAGRLRMSQAQRAMRRRTELWHQSHDAFLEQLRADIQILERRAFKAGQKPAVRLNGTSDVYWERFAQWGGKNLMDLFPRVQFYDYTKNPDRAIKAWSDKDWPKNYHITFSRSEENDPDCRVLLEHGVPITMVLRSHELKEQWLSVGGVPNTLGLRIPLVDGDLHDLTFLHPRGSVMLLKAKGAAKYDETGFVIEWPLHA